MQTYTTFIIIKVEIIQNKYLNTSDFQFHWLIICFHQLMSSLFEKAYIDTLRCLKRQIIDDFQNDLSRLHA